FSLRTAIALFLAASLLSGARAYYYKYKMCADLIAGWDGFHRPSSDKDFFREQGEMGVWALRDRLTSNNFLIRIRILGVLRDLGPQARSAVPELIKALDDSLTVYD